MPPITVISIDLHHLIQSHIHRDPRRLTQSRITARTAAPPTTEPHSDRTARTAAPPTTEPHSDRTARTAAPPTTEPHSDR